MKGRKHSTGVSGKEPSDREYFCPKCPGSGGFSLFGTFQQHMRKHDPKTAIPCDQCDQKFSNQSHLINHKKTHSKKHKKSE